MRFGTHIMLKVLRNEPSKKVTFSDFDVDQWITSALILNKQFRLELEKLSDLQISKYSHRCDTNLYFQFK